MTLPPAALPGWRATAPEVHVPHPGTGRPLGCPACGATDELVVDVPAVVHHRVQLLGIDGVTQPEVTIADADALPLDEETPDRATRLRCLRCRWAYTGPNAIGRARPPSAP